MKVKIKDKYVLLSNIKSLKDINDHTLSEFSNSNLIVDLGEVLKDEDYNYLEILSENFKKNGTSFVVRVSEYKADNFSETFSIAPTLLEAEDIITMEDLERELGF